MKVSRRVLATSIHLAASAVFALALALVIYLVWYPPPFATLSGGTSLFLIIACVDVILGPALTALVATPHKPGRELRRDLAIIVAVQVAALAYGTYTIESARPVWLSFEVDQFRVVSAADIEHDSLGQAPPALRELSWSGPKMIAAVKPTDPDALLRSIDLGMGGVELSMEPRNWRDYGSKRDAAWSMARPLGLLLAKYPQARESAADIARRSGLSMESLRFLPLRARQLEWSAVIAAPDARIVGYLPVEGFF